MAAIFADYSVKDLAEYAGHAELLRGCVPYLIIAERLHAEKSKLEEQVYISAACGPAWRRGRAAGRRRRGLGIDSLPRSRAALSCGACVRVCVCVCARARACVRVCSPHKEREEREKRERERDLRPA